MILHTEMYRLCTVSTRDRPDTGVEPRIGEGEEDTEDGDEGEEQGDGI